MHPGGELAAEATVAELSLVTLRHEVGELPALLVEFQDPKLRALLLDRQPELGDQLVRHGTL